MIELNERVLTREDLYDLVWQKPIVLIAEEFGLSDRGLAKICERNKIPTPSRGYWAKVEAGKQMGKAPLPALAKGAIPPSISIRRTPEVAPIVKEARKHEKALAAAVPKVALPEALTGLHPIVAEWVDEHRLDQEKTRRDARRNDVWGHTRIRADMTEHDRYRFKVTSAFLKSIEAAGGGVKAGDIRGSLELQITGETVKCTITHKQVQKLRPAAEDTNWTAWPEHFNSHLHPSGFLRFTINTWVAGQKEMVESLGSKADVVLPKFVARVVAAGPILVQERLDREAQRRQWQQEQDERRERERREAREVERWKRFRLMADNWNECSRLRAFLSALKGLPIDPGLEIDGTLFAEWIHWAEAKIDKLDPTSTPQLIFSVSKS